MVAIVIWFSLIPQPPHPPSFLGWDKSQHFIAYACLMYWFGMGFARRWRWVGFLIGLGIGLEFLQGWGGVRTFDLYDMLANTLGVLIGLCLLRSPLAHLLPAFDSLLAKRVGRYAPES